jgi:hypothetical protein
MRLPFEAIDFQRELPWSIKAYLEPAIARSNSRLWLGQQMLGFFVNERADFAARSDAQWQGVGRGRFHTAALDLFGQQAHLPSMRQRRMGWQFLGSSKARSAMAGPFM